MIPRRQAILEQILTEYGAENAPYLAQYLNDKLTDRDYIEDFIDQLLGVRDSVIGIQRHGLSINSDDVLTIEVIMDDLQQLLDDFKDGESKK